MSETGRYYIKQGGRTFVVEPLHTRSEKATDVKFKNGGISGDGVKGKPSQGGSISPEESVITEEMDPVVIGPFMSPESYVDFCIQNNVKLTDPSAVKMIEENKFFVKDMKKRSANEAQQRNERKWV